MYTTSVGAPFSACLPGVEKRLGSPQAEKIPPGTFCRLFSGVKRLLSPFCRARLLSVSSWSSSTFRLVGISFSFLLRGRRLLWRFRLRCAKFLVGERLLCRFRRGRRLLYRFRRELSRTSSSESFLSL